MGHGGRPWVSDYNHGNYQAARNALKTGTYVTALSWCHAILGNKCNALPWFPFSIVVFGIDPDMTREGGSIPVTLTLQEATGKNVVLLPLGACDDGAHSQNEKMDRKNYIEGVSIVAYDQTSSVAF